MAKKTAPKSPKKTAAPKPPRPRGARNKKKGADPEKDTSSEFERNLPVKISGPLIEAKRDRIVVALGEIHDLEQQLREMGSDKRTSIKEKKGEVEALRKQIGDGMEERPVKCIREMDFRANRVKVVRTDTRAIVEDRTMTAEDRQTVMPDAAKTPAAKDDELDPIDGAPPKDASEDDDA